MNRRGFLTNLAVGAVGAVGAALVAVAPIMPEPLPTPRPRWPTPTGGVTITEGGKIRTGSIVCNHLGKLEVVRSWPS